MFPHRNSAAGSSRITNMKHWLEKVRFNFWLKNRKAMTYVQMKYLKIMGQKVKSALKNGRYDFSRHLLNYSNKYLLINCCVPRSSCPEQNQSPKYDHWDPPWAVLGTGNFIPVLYLAWGLGFNQRYKMSDYYQACQKVDWDLQGLNNWPCFIKL